MFLQFLFKDVRRKLNNNDLQWSFIFKITFFLWFWSCFLIIMENYEQTDKFRKYHKPSECKNMTIYLTYHLNFSSKKSKKKKQLESRIGFPLPTVKFIVFSTEKQNSTLQTQTNRKFAYCNAMFARPRWTIDDVRIMDTMNLI